MYIYILLMEEREGEELGEKIVAHPFLPHYRSSGDCRKATHTTRRERGGDREYDQRYL